MGGSIFGKRFRVSTWGESHGPALGAVIDGCPAGLPLSAADIQPLLDRRKPGSSEFATKRSEADKVEILSGVFDGRTTGTPISLLIKNTDHRSADYSKIAEVYRPGHADFGFDRKYGFRDYRGGGRSSGRETAARVAAGAIAKKFLELYKIDVFAYTLAIGDVYIDRAGFDRQEALENSLCMPDAEAALRAEELVKSCMKQKDSIGGIIECRISGVMPGLGEPVFDKLDASLAGAVFSIGAVKGFEIGEGFGAAGMKGSENNDAFMGVAADRTASSPRPGEERQGVIKLTNHAGGILGGISDGSQIVFRAAIKPTPSIARPQRTVDSRGYDTEIEITGRHDPVIVPRAVVVVEAMAALVIADALLENMGARTLYADNIYGSDEYA